MKKDDFITRLQQEAKFQAKLNQSRLLPKQLDYIVGFLARNSWQVIVLASGVTALLIETL